MKGGGILMTELGKESLNLIKNIEFMNKLMKDIIIKKNTEKYENEFNEKTKEVEEVINILLNLF